MLLLAYDRILGVFSIKHFVLHNVVFYTVVKMQLSHFVLVSVNDQP